MTEFNHRSGQHLSHDGADIYYELVGDRHRKPLLMLHGGLGQMCDLNPVAAQLSGDYCLIGIDFRGHGRSTLGAMPLTYERYKEDVAAVLRHLDIDTFSVLGFSDGGIVGYRLAAEFQSRLRALVTVGAQWRLSSSDPVFAMLGGLTAEAWDDMFPASRAYYESVNPSPDFPRLVKSVVRLWTDLGATGYPNGSVRTITTPTLVVRGDNDFLLSLGEAAELRATLPTASFFNVPLAGHEVHKEAPGLLVTAVKDFLDNPRTPPTET